jgi:predicted kinase
MLPRMARPTGYMICGFVAAGKTTHSRQLEATGAYGLSIEQRLFARYGRQSVDFPEAHYPMLQARVRSELDCGMVELLRNGFSVVLDYGFWSRAVRDRYKEMITQAGGQWRLVYLRVDLDVVRRRIELRRRLTDTNPLSISDKVLDKLQAQWDPPVGEGEEILSM